MIFSHFEQHIVSGAVGRFETNVDTRKLRHDQTSNTEAEQKIAHRFVRQNCNLSVSVARKIFGWGANFLSAL